MMNDIEQMFKEGLQVVKDAKDFERKKLYDKAVERYREARKIFKSIRKTQLFAKCLVAHYANMIMYHLAVRDIEEISLNFVPFYAEKIEKCLGKIGLNKFEHHEILISAYRELEKICQDSHRIDEANDMYYKKTCLYHGHLRERAFQKDRKFRERVRDYFHSILSFFLHKFCGHGERPWRVLVQILLTIIFFSALFDFFYLIETSNNIQVSYGQALYFSVVTFTTLGYGDIVPACGIGRFFVALEVIIGLLMMGFFIAIIIRKMTK